MNYLKLSFSRGRLQVMRCPDGHWLLRLETGGKDSPWLELMPADAAWLAEVLSYERNRDDHPRGDGGGGDAPRHQHH